MQGMQMNPMMMQLNQAYLQQMMQQQQMSAYIASLREKANVRIKSDSIGLDGLSN
jgi:hypothetical protein